MKTAEHREYIRRQLLEGSTRLFSLDNQSRLAKAVHCFFPALQHAFLLYWLPEQAEDIYWLAVSRTEIAKIEVVRNQESEETAASVEIISAETYRRKRLSRQVRERLAVALDLIEQLE